MHHRKPVLHNGRGDPQSEAEGSLSERLTLRLPQWLRDRLDDVAEENAVPLSFDADDAGSVAREYLAAGMLSFDLDTYTRNATITGEDVDTSPDASIHENLDTQLTLFIPGWFRTHLDGVTGEGEMYVADSVTATARELLSRGDRLYDAGAFPFGEPVPPSDNVLCPHCQDEATELIWQRSFETHGDGVDVVDLFDDLSYERENPYAIYIQSNYTRHGWWTDEGDLDFASHPLHDEYQRMKRSGRFGGQLVLDASHPDVENEVTVAHCHICNYTDAKDEFRREWYLDRNGVSSQ